EPPSPARGLWSGPAAAFFEPIAALPRFLPVVPLMGGAPRLQPGFVDDVAEAIASILTNPGTVSQTYELAGPRVYTLRELVRMTLHLIGKRRPLIPVPLAVAEFQARLFEFLPNPQLTSGQVDLLKADNVASGTLPAFKSSIFNRNQLRKWFRPISAIGHRERAVRLGAPDDSEVVISPDLSIPLGVLKHTPVAHSAWTKDRLRGGRRLSGKKTLIGSSHSHAAPTSFSLRRHSSTRMRILPHRGDILPRVKP